MEATQRRPRDSAGVSAWASGSHIEGVAVRKLGAALKVFTHCHIPENNAFANIP